MDLTIFKNCYSVLLFFLSKKSSELYNLAVIENLSYDPRLGYDTFNQNSSLKCHLDLDKIWPPSDFFGH